MIRELHPHTKPQRATSPDNVPEESRRLGYEPSDMPPGAIARGFAVLYLVLGLIVGALALLIAHLTPAHSSLSRA